MLEGGYHLQYLLYCVALTRWLRWRDPGFDFDRQFGGVYYLFIRGMGGASDISLPGDGIFASCPSRVLIEDLDHLLSGQVP
jgi:exodeoxyribonuclease V beta subunit